jgi:hypothetical protein
VKSKQREWFDSATHLPGVGEHVLAQTVWGNFRVVRWNGRIWDDGMYFWDRLDFRLWQPISLPTQTTR